MAVLNEMLGYGGSTGGSSLSGGSDDIDALTRAIINGDYGNDEERKRRLSSDCAAVQRRVNEMLSQLGRNSGKRLLGGHRSVPSVPLPLAAVSALLGGR